MKILVGLSGASGVELGFCLLNALEKFTQNDEIFAIASKGAKMSFLAENLNFNFCEKNEAWQAENLGLKNKRREFESENLANTHHKLANKAWQATNSQLATPNFQNQKSDFSEKNSHAKKQKSEFKAQNLNANDEFIALCKEKFELKKTQFLDDENLAASVASGSFGINATIIAPCSLNTLAKIKHGFADTLITRGAAVALKERKKLILCVREMPFSTLALKQMTKLSKMGAIIAAPVYASYFKAQNLSDLQNFIIGKWLDLLEIPHDLYQKWA